MLDFRLNNKFFCFKSITCYYQLSKDHHPYVGGFIIPTPIVLDNIDRPVEEVIALAKEIYK